MNALRKIWEILKGLPSQAWEILSFVALALIAIFFKNKARTEEIKAQAAEADKANAVIKQEQADIKKEDSQVVQDGEAKKAEVASKTPAELAKDLDKL